MKSKIFISIFLSICSCLFSCKKLIEIDPPKSSLVQETIFKSDDVAVSALTGIYQSLANTSNSYASGGFNSLSCIAGTSSDEMEAYDLLLTEFYQNQVTPANSYLGGSLYTVPYKSIYTVNAILEGLSAPNAITPVVKTQIQGEALFIRAFSYFYLVNMYGPIPLQLTTDYRITQNLSRSSVTVVYQQILNDLKIAEGLLTETYVTMERVRPNKSAVQAMLARVYLYLQDWENAEKYASLVIAKSDTYKIVGLNDVFLKNSAEAIWQLMPTAYTNSGDGNLFILTSTPIYVSLSEDFVNQSFEPGDNRKAAWIRSYTNSAGSIYYYPYKYKIKTSTAVSEYSMVLRLAEQYLIRAEARINLNKIDLGISDLNLIRLRPLPDIGNTNSIPPLSATLTKAEALLSVEKERRSELFSEWGHRWFDLKRTNRASIVLSAIKPQWQNTDVLYPIPIAETTKNTLITQNPGY